MQDAELSLQQLQEHYLELVLLMRRMYQDCRLVHADLSEFNILVNQVSIAVLVHEQHKLH